MIQTAAPSVSSSIASPAGLPAGNGKPGSENGTFADILAGQPGPDGGAPAADTTPNDPSQPADPAADLSPDQPKVAAALPLTGKILPGLLPDLAAAADQAVADAEAATPDQAVPTLLSALRAMRVPLQTVSGAKSPAHSADPASTAPAEDEAIDGSALLALATLGAVAATPAAPANPAEGASPAASGLPPMIEAQLLGRPLQAQTGAAATPELTTQVAADKTDALALQVDPAQANRATAGALAFEPDSARPTTGVRLRPVIAGDLGNEFEGKAPAAPITDTAALLANPGTADSALQAPAAPSALPTSARPHDFAALMDRLLTARDVAQTGLPQSVQVAVNHAEFGQISLNFLQDKSGLAVSVANADPDFARAVQAAIPAVAAAAATDSARDSGQREGGQGSGSQQAFNRGDASAAGSNGGQRGQRGNETAQTGQAAPASNRSVPNREDDAPRQRGIFA